MKDGTAKRYYKKIKTTFSGVNNTDKFAKQFINLINSSDNEMYHKERLERRLFSDKWLDPIEDVIPVIDKITRNPRETLRKFQEVLPVERAKKTDTDTIKHLAANTQFIREINEDGDVTPSKVLTSRHDSSIDTYENRFLMSLIKKLHMYLGYRSKIIVEKMHSDYVHSLNVNSKIKWHNTEIDYDINLNIRKQVEIDSIASQNQRLLDRVTEVRKGISSLMLSPFMKEMSGYLEVKPPIMKTNILMKNIDFKQCYDLWLNLERVDKIDYEVDGFDRNLLEDKENRENIKNTMMVMYASMVNIQESDIGVVNGLPYNYFREKKLKVLDYVDTEKHLEAGSYVIENHHLNQYFLEQMRSKSENDYKSLLESGDSEQESIRKVYENLQEIADNAFINFLNHQFNPENKKTIEEKIEMQMIILEYYRDIGKAKREKNKEFREMKSTANEILNDYKAQLREKKAAIRAAEKAEEEKIRLENLPTLEIKAREERIKNQKIAECQKILDDAKKARMRKKKIKKNKNK
jgi:exonuclease SbcC